jgi:hypothetical protein
MVTGDGLDLMNFISFLATFSGGVFLSDILEIIQNQRALWDLPREVLQALLEIAAFNQPEGRWQYGECLQTDSMEEMIGHLLELSIINKRCWIGVKQERVGKDDRIVITLHPAVKRAIETMTTPGIDSVAFKAIVNSLVFHQILLTNIIRTTEAFEDLVEGSWLNKSLVWQFPAYAVGSLPLAEGDDSRHHNLQAIFGHYETNYSSLLIESGRLSLSWCLSFVVDGQDEVVRQKYLPLIEDVIVKTLTVAKILGRPSSTSQDYCFEIQNLYKTKSSQNLLSRLHYKAEFWQADKLFNDLKLSSSNMSMDATHRLLETIKNLEYIIENSIVEDQYGQL